VKSAANLLGAAIPYVKEFDAKLVVLNEFGTSSEPIIAPEDAKSAPANIAAVLSTLITMVACNISEVAVSVVQVETGIVEQKLSIPFDEGMYRGLNLIRTVFAIGSTFQYEGKPFNQVHPKLGAKEFRLIVISISEFSVIP
jgi:hypothetical protein